MNARERLNAIIEFGIRRIPKAESVPLLKSLRRQLEKDVPNRPAVRAVFGADKANMAAKVRGGGVRMIEQDGVKKVLHYRASEHADYLKTPRQGEIMHGHEEMMKSHIHHSGRAISTTVDPKKLATYGINSDGLDSSIGTYGTSLPDLVKNQRGKVNAAMVNNTYGHEREITQTNGDNLLRTRTRRAPVRKVSQGSGLKLPPGFPPPPPNGSELVWSARDRLNEIIEFGQAQNVVYQALKSSEDRAQHLQRLRLKR